MKKLRICLVDFLTDGPERNLFQLKIVHPSYSSVMPQCIAVWAQEQGHAVHYETYIGQDLFSCFPDQMDVLFLSGFSRASFLMYGVSEYFRKRGVITVLGGPHARSFPEHSRKYFDYVCKMIDKPMVQDLLSNISRQTEAVVLDNEKQPTNLPSVQERARFVEHNLKKSFPWFRVVPMVGSFGCPYTCSFCVDAPVPYRPMAYPGLIEDLRFIEKRWGANTIVGWHDPNFGVRFRDYMGVIEESGTTLYHAAESSMSLLGEENVKTLKKNRFVATLPGIESWYGYSDKSGKKRTSGEDKMRAVSEHINMIQSYIPYLQANFVLGLDDEPDASWELTKKFLDLSPGAFPSFNLFTNYRNSPLSKVLNDENRTTYVPPPLLDGYSSFNVKLKGYDPINFYDKLIDLMEHAWSSKAFYKRFQANQGWVTKTINLGRSYTAGRGWRLDHYRRLRKLMDTDHDFRSFIMNEQKNPPQLFFDLIRERTGEHAELIPAELMSPESFVESLERTTFQAPVIPAEKLEPLVV